MHVFCKSIEKSEYDRGHNSNSYPENDGNNITVPSKAIKCRLRDIVLESYVPVEYLSSIQLRLIGKKK